MTKVKHYAFLAFMAICPIVYCTIGIFDMRTFQERVFQLFGIGVVSLFFGNLWLTAFMLLNLFSLVYNDFTVGLPQVLNIFIGCLLFMVSRAYFRKNDTKKYLDILLWILAANCLWMIFQRLGIDPLYIAQDAAGRPQTDTTFRDCMGLFGIKMANAMFMGIALPILASLNIWLTPFILIPLYFCRSSVAALSILISMGFYLYHLHRRIFVWFLFAAVAGGAIYIGLDLKDDPKTFTSRFPAWHSAIKYSFERPLGWGPDSYRNYTKQKDFLFFSNESYRHVLVKRTGEDSGKMKYYDMDNGKMWQLNHEPMKNKNMTLSFWDNPHNEYVQLFFEYGFAGLIILIGLLREMYYRFKFSSKSKELVILTSCLLVFFVSGIGHFPMHLARIACLFPILLGAFYAKTEEAYG